MGLGRFGHRSILLSNGQVLVIGGWGYNVSQIGSGTIPSALRAVELFDPATNRWRTIGNTLRPHGDVWAEYLSDKNQLVFGSFDSHQVELLDLNTFKFSTGTTYTPAVGAKATLLANDLILIAGGRIGTASTTVDNLYIANSDTYAEGGMNGFFSVASVLDDHQFYINNPGYPIYSTVGASAATVTLCAALPGTIAGPYTYDVNGGVAVTSTDSTLMGILSAGRQYGSVTLADASQFPDAPGYLVFDFGGPNQVGPIKYFGKLSDVALVLDDSYIFTKTIPNLASVTLLAGKGPFVPLNPETYGSFYLTDSPAGRVGAENSLANNTAAGVNVTVDIVFPGDRGLGGEGYPATGQKISDEVTVWGSSDMDAYVPTAEGK
jgi:hypothetical protein